MCCMKGATVGWDGRLKTTYEITHFSTDIQLGTVECARLPSVGHKMCPHLYNFHAQYFYVLVPEIGKLITQYWLPM